MLEKDRNFKRDDSAVVRERRMTATEWDIRRAAQQRVRNRIGVAVLLFALALLAIGALVHHGR